MLNVVLGSKAVPTVCDSFAAETLAVQPEGVRLPNQQSLCFLSAGEVPPVALL